ncbi:unnamed protein product [Prorocentrum cordatum]|uniref:Uncharacterized protein n=1 Tax=Prorocentrum cordatum TaxID=2364126 RepID=A0ABN9SJR4_9DINO|nr:unnamed protein product [Polarella glacialis]
MTSSSSLSSPNARSCVALGRGQRRRPPAGAMRTERGAREGPGEAAPWQRPGRNACTWNMRSGHQEGGGGGGGRRGKGERANAHARGSGTLEGQRREARTCRRARSQGWASQLCYGCRSNSSTTGGKPFGNTTPTNPIRQLVLAMRLAG